MRRRAWLYCRVADDWSEETQNILEMQKAGLERFCAEHDLAITGTSMVTGKGVDELRELFQHGIEQDIFDLVVTLSVSRLARDTREIIKTVDGLTQHGKGYCMVKVAWSKKKLCICRTYQLNRMGNKKMIRLD